MREMKDSGIEFLGQIPVHWKVLKVKNLGVARNGLTYSPNDLCDDLDGTLVLRSSNVKNGKIVLEDNVYVSSRIKPYLMVKTGDILICSRNGSRELIGKNAIINDLKASFGAFMMIYRCEDSRFMYYVLNSPVFSYYLASFFTSTINQLTGFNFGNMQIAYCPDKAERCRISDYLDAKCDEIDSLIADIQSQIDVLEQYKRSIITETVTKGLNPDAAMKDSGIEWCMEIPRHWKIMPNKYLMKKKKIICPVYDGEDILSLTMNGVIVRDLDAGGKMPATFNGYQRTTVGYLLMCLFDIDVTPRCIGLIKNEGLTSPAYSQFQVNDEGYAPYYYYYYLMLDFTKELLHMAKNLRHSLTEDQLGAISVPVPPVSEQMDIANYLDEKCKGIDAVIADKQTQLATLDEYKKSLIFEYVTGKKEVTA